MAELHVVIGATGGAGSATVAELVARGKRVRATSRRPPTDNRSNVEWLALDATRAPDVEHACAGASVVYHCANAPYADWERQLIPMADAIVSAARKADATLIVMDNLYMYGPPDGPMSETTIQHPAGHKGRLRAALQQRYMDSVRNDNAKIAIGRASDFYGTAGASAATMLVIDPVLHGRSASWMGTLDAPHSLSYLPDVAWGLATLGERPDALGQIWHLPAAPALTARQFITLVCEAAQQPVRMSVINKPMMFIAGLFDPQIREASEVFYQFAQPFVIDATKFTGAFGSRITPHDVAVKETIAQRRRQMDMSGSVAATRT